MPVVQVSPVVQGSLSSQLPASLMFIALHRPVAAAHTPMVQSESMPVQSTAVPASQVLLRRLQVSVPLQSVASAHSASVSQVNSHASVQPSVSSPSIPSSHSSPGSVTELPQTG
ncbi:MAG TPA: hypothetical protein DEF51_45180, partial [Myxococcales bacterium]|nr:hypothetical protein [Myxococcales bacterium]